jgi:hypothetical protein
MKNKLKIIPKTDIEYTDKYGTMGVWFKQMDNLFADTFRMIKKNELKRKKK